MAAGIGGKMTVMAGTKMQEAAEFIETSHRSVSAFDAAVILFDPLFRYRLVRCFTPSPSSVRIARG